MDPFATLGLPAAYRLDRDALERRYRDLQRALHPDRFTHAPAAERRMALSRAVEVNEAYRVLRDDLKRAEAVIARRGATTVHDITDPELLMTVMELREALSEAKSARDLDAVRALATRVANDEGLARDRIERALDGEPPDVERARRALGELKYYRRFLDEVAVIEDEATSQLDATRAKS